MTTPIEGLAPQQTVAAVWRGGDRIALETLPVPEPDDGEVVVAVDLATVCGSDRHTVGGKRAQPCPSVLGHETVGRVVARRGRVLDAGGAEVQVGQRVVWSVAVSCGACDRCRAGITAKCRTVKKAGHEALDSGWALSGGYARHVLLPRGAAIVVVDDGVPDALAAPAACATATVMAVVEHAGDLSGRRVAVVGAGMLGLNAAAFAASAGAAQVVVADLSPGRRALAERFGATRTVEHLAEAGDTDVLLELSGSTAALQAALPLLDVGGVAVLGGSVAPDGLWHVDPETIVRNHLTLRGQHNYEPRHLAAALDFLARTVNAYPWAELVAAPRPLAALPGLLVHNPGPAPRYAVAPNVAPPARPSRTVMSSRDHLRPAHPRRPCRRCRGAAPTAG